MIGKALDFWFAPIQSVRLRLFEKAFAASFILYMSAWLVAGAREWLTDAGFHYSLEVSDLAFSRPMPVVPEWALELFIVVLLGAPLLVCLGKWRRPALLVCVGCAFYVQRVDTYSAFTINKLYLVVFIILLLAPTVRRVRVAVEDREPRPLWPTMAGLRADLRRFLGRPDPDAPAPTYAEQPRQSAWPVRVIQATLVIQYGTAGICKMAHGHWLERVDILVGHSAGLYRTEIATWALEILPHWAWVVQGVLALGFEVGAPIIFGLRSTRAAAYVLGVGMHIVIAVMMVDLIWFSLQMMTFYIVFVDAERLQRIEAAMHRWLGLRPASAEA